jgi:hypothetical protein
MRLSSLALPAAAALWAAGCGPAETAPGQRSSPAKLSGIGDSISQGFDATCCGELPHLGFGQGTDPAVASVYSRYRAIGALPQGKEFASRSGAEMVNDALPQAQAICRMGVKPDRIVLLLGGNDVCNRASVGSLYPVATFRSALRAALAALGDPACGLRAGSWVHVLSMPRVDLLRAAGLGKGGVQCEAIWTLASICRVVTAQPDPAVLAQIGAAVDAYNDGIAAEVVDADAANGGLLGVHFTTDWRGPRATHPDSSVGTHAFGPSDVSDVDCFHPSVAGQRKLACVAWETWELGTGDVAGCLR